MQQQSETTQSTTTNRELAFQLYLTQQGQFIHRVGGVLRANAFARGFKTFLSVFTEILLYLLFLGAVVLMILVPTDPLTITEPAGRHASFSAGIHSEELTALMILLKIFIFVLALPVLFCAVLLRRNRRKSALIARAYTETEAMKHHHDQATQYFYHLR